jgi:MFS family permease
VLKREPAAPEDRLFTPQFFLMCLYSFTVFLSAFQLFPTAPFRIIDLGGSTFTAGLFLGFLTYASALSAPLTGALADRWGRRKVLMISSGALTVFSIGYAASPNYSIPLVIVVFHGIFWSGLLAASSAYITDIIPAHRRAEGISYWGMASILAVAAAPSLGLWIYSFGWAWLCASISAMNLMMLLIAWKLPETARHEGNTGPLPGVRDLVEWRVLALSVALFMYAVGHGGATAFSAVFAHAHGIEPSGLFFTVNAVMILVMRPLSGPLADRLGHHKIMIPSLALIFLGLVLLAFGTTKAMFIAAAVVYGLGIGNVYPVFSAYIIQRVPANRRGAAFGSVLAAFDTGIGTGSIATGLLIGQFGYQTAFLATAALAGCAIPYFLIVEKRLNFDVILEGERTEG